MPTLLRIKFSPRFERSARALEPIDLKLLSNRVEIFKLNCFDPRLKTHKLRGKLKNFWSFSLNLKLRVIFDLEGDGSATLMDVGDHSIYQ